jgi:hypothetical protein
MLNFFKKPSAPDRRKVTEPFDAVDLAEVFGADLDDVVGGCAACGNPNHVPNQGRQDLWGQQKQQQQR